MQPSLQKLAKIANLQDRRFRISDTPIQTSLQKVAKMQTYSIYREFGFSDTPLEVSL